MNWFDFLFRPTGGYPFIVLIIVVYPIFRVLADDTATLKMKVLCVILILNLPVYGTIIYLLLELTKRVQKWIYNY